MSIWRERPDPEALKEITQDTVMEQLGIEFTEVGDDYLKGTMPVDQRTHQPMDLLHGGASVTLAETLGSFGGTLALADPEQFVVGIAINANHIRSVREGTVTGTARPVHLGRTTQVWEIEIADEEGSLVSISRLTLAVRSREST